MAGDTSTPNITVKTVDENGQEIVVNLDGANGNAEQLQTSTYDVPKEKPFPPFDPNTFAPQLFWLAISFGALYLLMSKVALPRIGEILEVRRDRIEGDLAEAERLRQKTDQAINAYEEELAQARAKSHEIAEKTRTSIKSELDAKQAEVEADLAKKLNIAEEKIKQTKAQALSNVDEIASETLVAVIAKLNSKISIKQARDAVKSVVKE